jgi:DNA polymerase-3 subunit beta
MYFTDNHALFQFSKATVVTSLLDGDFMRYDQIFSHDYTTLVYADRLSLLAAIDRATLISSRDSKKNPIRLQIESDQLIITSNTETGASYEEVLIETEGEPLDIRFNPKYFTDVLRAIDDERIAMQFTTVLSPCIIRGLEGDNYKYLILPQRYFG